MDQAVVASAAKSVIDHLVRSILDSVDGVSLVAWWCMLVHICWEARRELHELN